MLCRTTMKKLLLIALLITALTGCNAGIHTVYIGEVIGAWRK